MRVVDAVVVCDGWDDGEVCGEDFELCDEDSGDDMVSCDSKNSTVVPDDVDESCRSFCDEEGGVVGTIALEFGPE